MKPSHLAAIVMAGLGLGGMSTAAISAPVSFGQMQSQQSPSAAKIIMQMRDVQEYSFAMMQAGGRTGPPSGSYRRKNQRQIRLARRRKHAAGHKKAFC